LPAVEDDEVVFGTEAANRDEGAFAVRTVDRHAGDALKRLGEVGIRELAHFLGGDGVDDALGVPLDVHRLSQRGANSGDDDLVTGDIGRRFR
jgi:hypothetical protein